MAIRLRKKSSPGKIILSPEYAYGNVKKFLREELGLQHHKHVLQYKFFYSVGKSEQGHSECKSLYFVKHNVLVDSFSLEDIKEYKIITENIIMYMRMIGVQEEENFENIFEKYKL